MSLIRRYPLVEFFGLAYALSWILRARSPTPLRYYCKILCILIQGVDNPEQAPLRPATAPQKQLPYSPG